MTPMEDLKRRAGLPGDSFVAEIDNETLQWAIAEIERLQSRLSFCQSRMSDMEFFWVGSKDEYWGTQAERPHQQQEDAPK